MNFDSLWTCGLTIWEKTSLRGGLLRNQQLLMGKDTFHQNLPYRYEATQTFQTFPMNTYQNWLEHLWNPQDLILNKTYWTESGVPGEVPSPLNTVWRPVCPERFSIVILALAIWNTLVTGIWTLKETWIIYIYNIL